MRLKYRKNNILNNTTLESVFPLFKAEKQNSPKAAADDHRHILRREHIVIIYSFIRQELISDMIIVLKRIHETVLQEDLLKTFLGHGCGDGEHIILVDGGSKIPVFICLG